MNIVSQRLWKKSWEKGHDAIVTSATPSATRFLLVDDHEPFRKMMAEFLPAGVEVAECENGSAALEIYEDFRPEVVLMDVEMPVLDGISATRTLIDRHPEARIVILTQHDSPEMERAAFKAGAVAFQPKADLGSLPGKLSKLFETQPD